MKLMMKTRYQRTVCAVLAAVLAGMSFSGCSRAYADASSDVLTQKPSSDGRTKITVLVKYAFSINDFEKAVEEKFPDIDIVQVGNYTRDMGIEEYKKRLEHDDLTDIVMTWPLDVGEEYWPDRLLDLSGFDFTSRYNVSVMDSISRDGKLYYLPGPSQVRGIVYNKTLFEEKGWTVPENFEEFISLCRKIEASGMRSLQLGLENPEVLDTAFVGYSFTDCFSKPQDTQWIAEYNNGQHSFGDHFAPALDHFQTLIDAGILRESDLDVNYSEREKMFFTRQCAMVEDSVLLARMGYSQTGSTDEFALMPFFDPCGDEWARLYMVCYIGLNQHLAEPKNKKKYDAVLKLMDYISTCEGQEALMSDTGAMFSNLIGVDLPEVPEIQDLLPALHQGHYAIFPELKNAQTALRAGLAGMVRGDMDKETVIKTVDAQNLSPPKTDIPEKLGTASSDFTLIETGSFVTDAMRKASGCEIALFMDSGKDGKYNAKGLSARLYQGDQTANDLNRILPALKYDASGTLWKVTMTGGDLIKTLEYSIPVDNNISGWFYYFSGLHMKYAPSADPGSRIQKITLEDGGKIDPKKKYSIAVMENTVSEEYLISCEKTDITIFEILKNEIKEQKTISPPKDGRFVLVDA